jgi:hypothetical protein
MLGGLYQCFGHSVGHSRHAFCSRHVCLPAPAAGCPTACVTMSAKLAVQVEVAASMHPDRLQCALALTAR